MARVYPVLHVLGMIIALFGLTMLLPLTISFVQADGATAAYDKAILITLLAGVLLWLATSRTSRELRARDGFLLVVLIWVSVAGRCSRRKHRAP